MFAQHINIINMASDQEFMKICNEHLGCKDCPLKDKDIQLQSGLTRCETGHRKGGNNG